MTEKSRQIRAWVDGACEPRNPGGTATYGVIAKQGSEVLFSESGVVCRGREASNNVGEYGGLLAFLIWFVPTGKKEAVVYSDSQLLIKQMTGEWRVRGGLYVSKYSRAVQMIRENNLKLTFVWLPREQNGEADKLSKDALAAAGVQLKIQRE